MLNVFHDDIVVTRALEYLDNFDDVFVLSPHLDFDFLHELSLRVRIGTQVLLSDDLNCIFLTFDLLVLSKDDSALAASSQFMM